ncbi:hypothetical protein SCHPADRAFT_939279 [Schizopora paradoxa]|uniref:F-box domain-containing protein n=1 Tax=Schizopora paradoxa TaxID=27342 RepID=A0A0H2RRV3_9AGAM|nr:hypothetical protein SCHPADRAFT_939279 [Schizopora paradoxa]
MAILRLEAPANTEARSHGPFAFARGQRVFFEDLKRFKFDTSSPQKSQDRNRRQMELSSKIPRPKFYESTQPQGESYIKEDAFPIIADILTRIQTNHGRLGAQQDWLNDVCPPYDPVIFRYESKAQQSTEDVERAARASEALNVASQALSQLAELISVQAAASKEYATSLKHRKTFSSLPGEILAVVLEEIVVRNSWAPYIYNEREAGPAIRIFKAATKLSHTCQRFRSIIFQVPSLWNRIHSSMPQVMFSTCFERVATAIMQVNVDDDSWSDPQLVTEFIGVAKSYSPLWESFNFRHKRPLEELGDGNLLECLNELNTPSLTSLSIWYSAYIRPESGNGLQEALHYYSTWSMPKLLKMTIRNIIPIPFPSSPFLKYLDLELTLYHEAVLLDFKPLVAFIASCVNLEELKMYLSYNRFDGISFPAEPVTLARVRKLTFRFHFCPREHVKLVMSNLLFPVVSCMSLDLEHLDGELSDISDNNVDDDDVLSSIFESPSCFPKLTDLELKLGEQSFQRHESSQIKLPFNHLRTVKQLKLNLDYFGDWQGRVRLLIPKGECLPSLRSLSLECCTDIKLEWITSLLGRLHAQGILQSLELTVTSCSWIPPPSTTTFDPDQPDTGSTEGGKPRAVKYTAEELRQLVT